LLLVLSFLAYTLCSGLTANCSIASNLLTAYTAFAHTVDRD
jgi:hypothetical protein